VPSRSGTEPFLKEFFLSSGGLGIRLRDFKIGLQPRPETVPAGAARGNPVDLADCLTALASFSVDPSTTARSVPVSRFYLPLRGDMGDRQCLRAEANNHDKNFRSSLGSETLRAYRVVCVMNVPCVSHPSAQRCDPRTPPQAITLAGLTNMGKSYPQSSIRAA
jgi:hypothetical protein